MRSLLPGVIVGVFGLIIALFTRNSDFIIYSLFIIGLIPIIISGFMSGAYVSGDRVRGNYSNSIDFKERSGISSKLFLFGLPCVITAMTIYYINQG